MNSRPAHPIRILLVEDSILVRQGLKSVIGTFGKSDLQVVGEAGTNAEAVAACDRLKPAVVLLDIRLPDGNGFQACREILQRHPTTRIIVLTSHSNDNFVYEAITAGAHGYLMKEVDPAGLVQSIRDVAAGQSILAPDVTDRVLKMLRNTGTGRSTEGDLESLSHQERRVLMCVAEGLTNKQTGERLSLSENTVKNYLINVFEKLQVKRRAQAAALYVQQAGRPTVEDLPPPRDRRPGAAGFTIVEVMLAAVVLTLGITTAIITLQRGLQAVDTARNYTYAGQLMQSELESLRLKNWTQLETLQNAGPTAVTADPTASVNRTAIACTRTISTVKTDMKEILLVSTWRGYDGRTHSTRLITRYGKSGLYDYFYTAH
jgi:DNA-binding NarL/FixJ family response regulator